MIASALMAAVDPARFAERAGITPDPWQAEVLRSGASRLLLNCSRQSGKTTITALLALHTALYQPESLVLVLAPTQRQSQLLYRALMAAYAAVGEPVPASAESALRLELANGSAIHALPGTEKTIRGYSGVSLILVDEAARVPDELYFTVTPMLAVSGGRLVALSTPFGTRGWWYDAWEHGGAAWERYRVPAAECPRIPPAFLEEERRNLGSWWYGQEFENEFLDAQSAAFGRADIDAAFKEEVETWTL